MLNYQKKLKVKKSISELLNTLGKNAEHWDSILIYTVSTKLGSETRKRREKFVKNLKTWNRIIIIIRRVLNFMNFVTYRKRLTLLVLVFA